MNMPPIGLMPRWLHNELMFDDTSSSIRVNEINEAVRRYEAVSKPVPSEWIKEREEIINENNKRDK